MFTYLCVLAAILAVVFLSRPSAANRTLARTVFRESWILIPQLIVIGILVVLPLGRAFLGTDNVIGLSYASAFQAICCYVYVRLFIQIELGVVQKEMSARQSSLCHWGALAIAILSGSLLSLISDGYALLFPSMNEGRVSHALFETSLVYILIPLLLLLALYFGYLAYRAPKSRNANALKSQSGPPSTNVVIPLLFLAFFLAGSVTKLLPASWANVLLIILGAVAIALLSAIAESKFLAGTLVILFVWFFLPGFSLKATVASAFLLILCFYCYTVDENCEFFQRKRDGQDRTEVRSRLSKFGMIPLTCCITLIAITSPLWLMIPRIADYGGGIALSVAMVFWTSITFLLIATVRYCGSSLAHALALCGLLLGFFLWQALGENRYHTRAVRLISAAKASPKTLAQNSSQPKPLSQFAADWFSARKEFQSAQSLPVILVASAGGGIRAAYWSSRLLAALESESIKRGKRPFSQQVLAISSVSGGSLGAAVFVSSLKSRVSDLPLKSDQFLARDFVGPIVGPMMIRDLFTSAFRYRDSWDRGIALEQAFERAWGSENANNPFEMQIESLWDDAENLVPMLLLNSTDAETGTSIVKSNCSLSNVEGLDSDRQRLLEQLPMRLSTACLLSARFPYASPEGSISGNDPNIQMRLVDGGYCDNSGNATLLAIIDVLDKAAKQSGFNNVRFVVLSIDNAPMAASKQQYQGGPGSPARILATVWQKQTTTMYTEQIKERVGENSFFGNWQPQDVDSEYPLSWYQSSSTCKSMTKQISEMAQDDHGDFTKIIDLLLPISP